MKLKAVVGTLEGLSEEVATLYKKEGNVFVLDLDGVDDHPSVQNLSKTVKTVRTEKNEFEKQLKILQDKISGLDIDSLKKIDPGEYEKSIAELAALKLEQEKRNIQKLKDEKNWEKLELQLKDQHAKDLASIVEKHSSEKDSLLKQMEVISGEKEKSLTGMQSALKKHLKDKELTAELAKAKGNIPLLTPHISPFIDVRPNEAGDYEAIVIGPDKNQRFNNAGKPMSIGELVLEFKEKPEFKGEGVFEIAKQSGGSGSNGSREDGSSQKNPFAKETLNLTEQSKLFATDKVLYDQLKAAAA